MAPHARTAIGALGLALASLATARVAAAQTCTLEYQRADNMWAAFGRPDGSLGTESITLPVIQTRVFVTDWKYEKQRSDGTNYYGSHLRVATNKGQRPLRILLRGSALGDIVGNVKVTGAAVVTVGLNSAWVTLDPGVRWATKSDLVEVMCPGDGSKGG